jgi:hypothetical protein
MIDTSRGQILRRGTRGDLQLCVPAEWTDEQVREYANHAELCGTVNGWQIMREGNKLLNGNPERIECENLAAHVHIRVEA